MTLPDRVRARRAAERLEEPVRNAAELARSFGLDPYTVNYWIVDHDEMNQLIAYEGFQRRYPHWRWGMGYERQQKQGQFLGGKAFEIVNNDDPAHAFLLESNALADQKAVITHVEAHADFFANNEWFGLFTSEAGGTGRQSPDASAMLARHADVVEEYMADPDIGRAAVEEWIDHALCIEEVIDQHAAYVPLSRPDGEDGTEPEDLGDQVADLALSEEVREEVFDREWLEAQADDDPTPSFPAEPEADLLAFLARHGKQYDGDADRAVEMDEWQREVLEIVRREAYYFAPQRMTKVMNEGWACVAPETPVFTAEGLVSMGTVLADAPAVSDGECERGVYDTNVIEDHDTVTIETRRGLELTGSNNHRIRRPDGSWIRLDDIAIGDDIAIAGGNDLWPDARCEISWDDPSYPTLEDVAEEAGVSVWTVMRYRRLGRARNAEEIESALARYDPDGTPVENRAPIRVPPDLSPSLARFLGLVVGDGHVSETAGQVGFTTGERDHAAEFAGLASELFGVEPTVERDGSGWRVSLYSRNLVDLLRDVFDLPDGKAAATKLVPPQVRRSPETVVAEFLRGLFDADGYAGEQGVILSSKSERLSETVQLLLMNFGILNRRREQTDGCHRVHVTGRSARLFADEIGFAYSGKSDALASYLDGLEWLEREQWTDEVVSVTEGTGTVYDISVEETHRYAGGGFVNHNSYWESRMMADEGFAGKDEFVLYADHMAKVLSAGGLNPYKLGLELWTYVENAENRREVVERLLRVEGVTPRTFHDEVDFGFVQDTVAPDPELENVADHLDGHDPDDPRVDADALEGARAGEVDVERYPWKVLTCEGMAERHYSLCRPQHRGFVSRIGRDALERLSRYMFDRDRYATVAEALEDVDYARGWDRMREIRESHNDVTFIDEFLTQEFVDEHDYFAYEYSRAGESFRVSSTDYEDVKKKLLLQFTNFGTPTITVEDGNYRNRNELLLGHRYNGVVLDVEQATETLKRLFDLWGRPVNLLTIAEEYDDHDVEVARRRDREPDPEAVGKRLRYDGEDVTVDDVEWEAVAHLAADDVDYDTKPEDWLA